MLVKCSLTWNAVPVHVGARKVLAGGLFRGRAAESQGWIVELGCTGSGAAGQVGGVGARGSVAPVRVGATQSELGHV